MAAIWSDESKLRALAGRGARGARRLGRGGRGPAEAVREIRERAAPPSPARVAELEARLHHDTAAFVDAVSEQLGPEGRWFHYGLTSSDVVDTALALQIQEAGALILAGVERALAAVVARAEEHRLTLCIGRTHGVHAEPTTFGLKLAVLGVRARPRTARASRARSKACAWASSRAPSASTPRSTPRSSDSPASGSGSSRRRVDADPPARPARGAARRARGARVLARQVRARDPPPGAHGGARGRGAVRARAEGLVGDAAQAQPGRRRTHLRARTRRSRGAPSSGSRTSRSGTSGTSRTPRPSAS